MFYSHFHSALTYFIPHSTTTSIPTKMHLIPFPPSKSQIKPKFNFHFQPFSFNFLLFIFLLVTLIPNFSVYTAAQVIQQQFNCTKFNFTTNINNIRVDVEGSDEYDTSVSGIGSEFNLRNKRNQKGGYTTTGFYSSSPTRFPVTNSSGGSSSTSVDGISPSPTPSSDLITTLWILGLFELTENNMRREYGVSEKFAAQLALDDINQMGILGKYKLIMHTNDTQCDAGAGVDAFFHALYTNKETRIMSLLGTACSEVTERLAKIVPYWNMVQVSFGSTSPSLSDRTEFPLFYRTVSTVSSHNNAIIALIQHFHWDTVTFFTINENQFTMPANYLVTELGKANVTCKAAFTFSLSDLREQLKDMKEMDARIIIASFGSSVAPNIFCEIYQMGMYGGDYAWIFLGKPEISWWSPTVSKTNVGDEFSSQQLFSHDVNCTFQQLSSSLESTLFVDRHNFIISDMTSVSGMNASQFRKKFQDENLEESPYAPETYDAVWSIALALQSLLKRDYNLASFDYNNSDYSGNLMTEMSRLEFNGISGPVSFAGANRIGITSFSQIQGGRMVAVGLYFPRKSFLELNCSGCQMIRWPDNQVPIASREFRFKIIRVETSLYFIVASVAFGGIIMAAGFLAFNLINRKLKYIKLSSPRLNNNIICGCILSYSAVILLGSEFGPEPDSKHFAYICFTRAYLLSAGFSLAFGSMFAKVYRIHRIFTRSCAGVVKNKLLRDRQLMILIMALLAIDCVVVTSWGIFDPMHRTLKNLTLENDPEDRAIVYQTQIEICRSEQGHVWLIVLYGYKSLLLMVGLYMAWETRHVKIQVLNDSKYIGLCVYIVVLTSVLAVSLANLISERVTLCFVSVSALILSSTTITLWLLFLPKIHAVVKGTNLGNPVVESMGLKIQFNTRRFMVEDTKELLFRAEVQNRVYKRQIKNVEAEILRLELLLTSDRITPQTQASIRSQLEKTLARKNQGEGEEFLQAKPSSPTNRRNSNDETTTPKSPTDIFTVYLQGPRFIIPLNLLDVEGNTEENTTPTTTRNDDDDNLETQILTLPTNGLITKMYRIKSEPKLEGNSATAAVSLASSTTTCQYSNSSSRKNSSASIASSTLFNLLKYPITYVTSFLRPPTTASSVPSSIPISNGESKATSRTLQKDRIFPRQKFSSVPNLWGVKSGGMGGLGCSSSSRGGSGSPIFEIGKKTSLYSNPDSFRGGFSDTNPSGTPYSETNSELTEEDQILLKLIETSAESPYL